MVFFVLPTALAGRIAFLAPGDHNIYLAFANERMSFDDPERQSVMGQPANPVRKSTSRCMRGQDFGLSTYDKHADGTGAC